MFPSSPGHATDAQLSMMAKGGLPNAVNEEITRLALRRGSRAVPQQPVAPAQGKMTGEEMIDDFVRRVRQENANSAQSIVPAGTPQGQPPQQQQPPQQPPQPAPAPGIAGYSSGGVRGFQDGGGRDPKDFLPGLDRNGHLPTFNPYTGRPMSVTRPEPKPRDPDYQTLVDLSQGRMSNLYDGYKPIEGHHPEQSPYGIQPFAPQEPSPLGGSGETGIAGLMSDFPTVGGFKPTPMTPKPEYKAADMLNIAAEGERSIDANKDKIDALKEPYMTGAAELQESAEEIKRKQIFNGLWRAGAAMMQRAGASFDPRSGDMMAVLGDGVESYADSLSKDDKRIEDLRGKIVAYKGAANELGFNAENSMYSRGADTASAMNTQNIARDGSENQYNLGAWGTENSYNQNSDQLRMSARGQDLQASLSKWEASLKIKLAQEKGLDPELAEKIANNAGQLYQSAYNTYLSQAGFSEATDPAKRTKILEAAQAQGIASSSAYLDRVGSPGGIADITSMEQGRYTAGAGIEEYADDGSGTAALTGYTHPYAPRAAGGASPSAPDVGSFFKQHGLGGIFNPG